MIRGRTAPTKGRNAIFRAWGAVAVLLLVASGCNRNKAVEADIRAAYARQDQAVVNRNVEAYYADYAPDFHTVGVWRPSGLAEDKERHAFMMKMFATAKENTKLLSVSVTGEKATARTFNQREYSIKNPQTGKLVTMLDVSNGEDEWVRRDGKWLKLTERSLNTRTTMDGREIIFHKDGPPTLAP